MTTKKKLYKCAVNGCLGRRGKYIALCGKVKCGSESYCGAHGNSKCVHRIEVKENKNGN